MKSKRLFKVFGLLIVAVMVLTSCAPAATPAATEAPTQAAAPTTPPTAAATEAPTAAATEAPTAAATEAPTTAPSGKTTITIGTTDKIASLDPADAYATHDWEILKNISEGLVMWKPGELTLVPGMATDLGTKSADGLTYTFTLKDGIKFGDGTPLDATSYAAQLNRLLTVGADATKCPDAVAPSLAIPFVKSIEAPDAKTIVFTLNIPIAYFPQLLATGAYLPADPKIFPADNCALLPPAPIYGTGPWYISQYTQNESMVFEPNPYYTGELKPQVDQIVYRFYSDPNTMSLAVQNGEIDIAWRILDTGQINDLKKVSTVTVGAVAGGGIRHLLINHTMAPTDDPNVAKAIASAVDRNAIVDTVYAGAVIPIYSDVPPGFPGANEAYDAAYASPNIDQAKKYLEASGYTASNPLKLDVWYPPDHYGASTTASMQVIKTQLEATGAMQVTLRPQEWSTYLSAAVGGKSFAVCIMGWFFDFPDTSNYLDPFVYNGGQGTNATVAVAGSTTGDPVPGAYNADATKLVDLLTKADVELDPAKRADLYQQAQDVAASMVLTVPLYFVPEFVVFRPNIQGSSDYATPETLNIGPNIEFNYATLSKTP
jgi:peptide/nickel transport system substrate-binding protein